MIAIFCFSLGNCAKALGLSSHDISIVLYNWQTLIAGGLALLGARWTVTKIQIQIDNQEKQNLDKEKRLGFTARAELPQNVADGQIWLKKTLIFIYEHREGHQRSRSPNLDEMPRHIFEKIAGAAKYLPITLGEDAVIICRNAQVINTRLSSRYKDKKKHNHKDDSKLIATTYNLMTDLYYFIDGDETPNNGAGNNDDEQRDKALISMFLSQNELHLLDYFRKLWVNKQHGS
jgi:hypothetical protein